MKHYIARGTCETCHRFTQAKGATKADATLLLTHEHGYEYKHTFVGEVEHSLVKDK